MPKRRFPRIADLYMRRIVAAIRAGAVRVRALLSAADYAPAARTRLVCGAGFLQYPEMLQNARAELSQIAPVPNAAAVAEIAATMLIEGETLPPEKCTPRYIRRKIAQTIAERMRER